MSDSPGENLRFVLSHLAKRMKTAKEALYPKRKRRSRAKTVPPGVVFVLGAGCSIQYGLPGFKSLLGHAYDDLGIETKRDTRWELDSLRDRLDPHWRTQKPGELRDLLDAHLRRIDGHRCTAYLRLARLAREGYVKAIVNMNFDLLLEEAFARLREDPGREYFSSKTFRLPPTNPAEPPQPRARSEGKTGTGAREPAWKDLLECHRRCVPVYMPHGSLRPMSGVPILDLAGSDLFDSHLETEDAMKLFRENDVVFLGYRGADAKIAAALMPERAPSDREEVEPENYNQIYVLNIESPDPRLLRIMVARRSTELAVTGEIASFENVMAELDHLLRADDESDDGTAASPDDAREVSYSRHFTGLESRALDRCRHLALDLRSSMSIAEGGQISIEEHAAVIFDLCLELSRSCGLGLSTPEKYVLFCAAYLHDLGYFWAYSGNRKYKKAGWHLLATHGHDTATLLDRHFRGEPDGRARKEAILPASYRSGRDELIDTIIVLCYLHSGTPIPELPRGIELENRCPLITRSFDVEIDGFPIPVRPPLLHALFHTAEEITQGHPFRPAPYPLELHGSDRRRLEDPVLDLYLGQKSGLFEIDFAPRKVAVKVDPGGGGGKLEKTRTLLALLTQCAVSYLSQTVADLTPARGAERNGDRTPLRAIELDLPPEIRLPEARKTLRDGFPEAARLALDEQLEAQLARLELDLEDDPSQVVGLVPTVLDLLSIYTDPVYLQKNAFGDRLYTPQGDDPGFDKARTILNDHADEAGRHLIYAYMRTRYLGQDDPSPLERVFCHSFETVYRPAWRFCADKWLYGVDALVMARASLDFGSSRYRDEVALGLKNLVQDKVETCTSDDDRVRGWPGAAGPGNARPVDEWAFGHDGCTVCTGRLLYILTKARQLLSREMRDHCGVGDRGLSRTTGAILRFFLRRPPRDASWWGIEAELRHHGETLESADYVAWAVKATAHALLLDHQVAESTGGGQRWLEDECGIPRADVEVLFRNLLDLMGEADRTILLGDRTEEPHSYILGHVGGTYLYLKNLEEDHGLGIVPATLDWDSRAGQVREALEEFDRRQPAQLSQFFLWPAEVFVAHIDAKNEAWNAKLVGKLAQCLTSRVWIKNGEGAGSWGYNIENTQRIVSSLNTFWSLAFRAPDRFEGLFDEGLFRKILGA